MTAFRRYFKQTASSRLICPCGLWRRFASNSPAVSLSSHPVSRAHPPFLSRGIAQRIGMWVMTYVAISRSSLLRLLHPCDRTRFANYWSLHSHRHKFVLWRWQIQFQSVNLKLRYAECKLLGIVRIRL